MTNERVLPFIEHLVELRKRLIICVVALVIGMGISWNFSNILLSFVEKPLTGKTYLTELKKSFYGKVKERYPAIYKRYELDKDVNPPVKDRQLNYSAPLEPFFIQCKISMIAGFIVVLPVVFHQVWLFIAPGLTRKEKRLVVPFVTASSVSFCIGAMFFLLIIWPVIINAIEARQTEIADGLAAAEKGQNSLATAKVEIDKLIAAARDQARAIVDQANTRLTVSTGSWGKSSPPNCWISKKSGEC